MSVILYEKQEILAMMASSWHHGSIGSTDGKRRLVRFAETANRIAQGNALAFTETYSEACEPINITAREIEFSIVGKTVDTMRHGYRTLRGIRYNLIANNGADFATSEILDDLLMLVSAHADRMSK